MPILKMKKIIKKKIKITGFNSFDLSAGSLGSQDKIEIKRQENKRTKEVPVRYPGLQDP